jgi:hypothetical protein
VALASDINFTNEDDSLICKFHSSQSLYGVINFRGITPVYVSAIWKRLVPPRVHFFLWLLSHNILLTKDNLMKRMKIADCSCLFCCEEESVRHLFFECVVIR